MAKPTVVEGLDASTPVRDAARRLLVARLGDLRRPEDGVRAGDADAVHDMRVATRRLRAALAVLDPDGRLEEAALEVKRLGDALGHVRDVDVSCAWLADALDQLAEGAPARIGIERLLARRREDRLAPDQELAGTLDRWTAEIVPRLETHLAGAKGRGRLGGGRLRRAFSRGLRSLGRAQDDTLRSPDPETAHDLRIRAKKLRYRAEVLEPALPDVAGPLLHRLSHLQELLGDLHDADVRHPLVERHLVTGDPVERPGALELLQQTLLDRDRLRSELVIELRAWQADRVVADLRKRLE